MAQRRRLEADDRDRAIEESDAPPEGSGEPSRDVTNDEISIRAYELYEQRGAQPGSDWNDWFEAERELQARRRSPGPTPS
jgi:hypothetical protein